MPNPIRHFRLCFALVALLPQASLAAEPNVHAGRAEVYQSLQANSLEQVTRSEAMLSELRFENVAPSRVWKLLEHGEKVECLACIPRVSELLFQSNPKVREISAWWLRRRVFGVFGKNEVYSRVLATLASSTESESQRSYAANALGEFLSPAGIPVVARAVVTDASPRVRASAVAALQRLNHEGPARELGQALADVDEAVRLAALQAAVSINVFSSVDEVVARISDPSALVRRRVAETLGALRVSDSVVALVLLASEGEEADAEVRAAAVWALGQLGDPAGKQAVDLAVTDSSPRVRNAAAIARRRL